LGDGNTSESHQYWIAYSGGDAYDFSGQDNADSLAREAAANIFTDRNFSFSGDRLNLKAGDCSTNHRADPYHDYGEPPGPELCQGHIGIADGTATVTYNGTAFFITEVDGYGIDSYPQVQLTGAFDAELTRAMIAEAKANIEVDPELDNPPRALFWVGRGDTPVVVDWVISVLVDGRQLHFSAKQSFTVEYHHYMYSSL
jgi:hypothetical protein